MQCCTWWGPALQKSLSEGWSWGLLLYKLSSSQRELCISLSITAFCQVRSFHSGSVHHQPCPQFILYKLRCCNWTSPSLHSLVLKHPKCLIQAWITPLTDYRHPASLFIRRLLISVVVLRNSIISVAQLQ